MSHEKTNTKIFMPETSHIGTKILFVMTLVLAFLLIFLYISDRGKEGAVQRFKALSDGIVATMPMQAYLTNYYSEHKSWPDGAAVLEAVAVDQPASVKSISVGADGVITLMFTDMVHEGGLIHLKPLTKEGASVKWSCEGENLPEDVLPKQCILIAN